MFIRSIRLRRPGLILILAGVVAAAAVLLLGMTVSGAAGARRYRLETEEQRLAFMEEMGWEVDKDSCTTKNVVIPEDWNQVYESYNELQKDQGFDLTAYRGKTVQLYTYTVLNYPEHPEGVICDLMVFDGALIGGDVCSVALDGFMQGLRR